ncbi:MAG: hypothetical protein AB7T38_09705 [Nitrospirales bacterium]
METQINSKGENLRNYIEQHITHIQKEEERRRLMIQQAEKEKTLYLFMQKLYDFLGKDYPFP